MTQLTGMMERNKALFSGKYTEYRTPKKLYNELNEEFHFTLDPCTTYDNPLGTPLYYTIGNDGLSQSWQVNRGSVFVNPPYGRNIGDWVKKAYDESNGELKPTVVMLLPARTDTKWFHDYILGKSEIRFIRGRLKFEGDYGSNTAPFPSMIVVFRPNKGTIS